MNERARELEVEKKIVQGTRRNDQSVFGKVAATAHPSRSFHDFYSMISIPFYILLGQIKI